MNKSMECVAYLFAPEGLEKLDFGICISQSPVLIMSYI